MPTHAARLSAFHASRRNAADANARAARPGSPAHAAWLAVSDAHAQAARTGSQADSDAAEAAHDAAYDAGF